MRIRIGKAKWIETRVVRGLQTGWVKRPGFTVSARGHARCNLYVDGETYEWDSIRQTWMLVS